MWCRIRRRRLRLPTGANNEEESIPLTSHGDEEEEVFRKRKGKEKAEAQEGEPIFNVGDIDDEDGYYTERGEHTER
jgi:carboxypeptidase D